MMAKVTNVSVFSGAKPIGHKQDDNDMNKLTYKKYLPDAVSSCGKMHQPEVFVVKILLLVLLTTLLVTGCSSNNKPAQQSAHPAHSAIVLKPGETDEVEVSTVFAPLSPISLSRVVQRIPGIGSENGIPCSTPSDLCVVIPVSAEVSTPIKLLDRWGLYTELDTNFNSSSYSIPVSSFPLTTEIANPVIKFAAGKSRSLAVLSDGSVWSWGRVFIDQLGVETLNTPSNLQPLPVQISGLQNIGAIAVGEHHSLALNMDGSVWSWGGNSDGQLGNGSDSGSGMYNDQPLQVVDLAGIIAIAAGPSHSLALASDGTVWAWGDNSRWQLSTGNGLNSHETTPVQIPNLGNIISIAAGEIHSLALDSNGNVWTWGGHYVGQSGTPSASVYPQQVDKLDNIIKIAAAGDYSMALRSDNTVFSWGRNTSNQLGYASPDDCAGIPCSKSPRQITSLVNILDIAAGEEFAIARSNDGKVWAWGSNKFGQLAGIPGLGSLSPVQVQGLSNVLAIAAGYDHALAMSTDEACDIGSAQIAGRLMAWGNNLSGQRGDGTGVNWFRPTPVLTLGDDATCPELIGYRVIIYKAGTGDGTIQSDAPGLTCTGMLCWQSVSANTSVTFSAVPNADSEFADWRWDCSSSNASVSMTLNAAKVCKVRFNRVAQNTPPPASACNDGMDNDEDGLVDLDDPGCDSADDDSEINAPSGDFTLTISIIGSGEVFDNNDYTYACFSQGTISCEQTYAANEIASLRAYNFSEQGVASWTSGCDNGTGVLDSCEITMNSNKTVIVTMQQLEL